MNDTKEYFNFKNFNLTTHNLESEYFLNQNKENKTNKKSHDSISQNLQEKPDKKQSQ
jgi:hypothetical protein